MITIQLNDAHPVSRYAARELEAFLRSACAECVAGVEAGPAGDRRIVLDVRPDQPEEVAVEHTPPLTALAGRTPAALLHSVYHFLERLGYVFTATGPVAPCAPAAWPAPFSLRTSPVIAQRGIRQHLNFPMDITCLPLEQAREYVRNLARLKLNVLALHLYPNQGWLHLDHGGYRVGVDPEVTLYYSQRHPVCSEPAVRARSANREVWFIPELEGVYRTAQQREGLRAWLRGVIQTARECGLTVSASVESLSPASDRALAAAPANLSAIKLQQIVKEYIRIKGEMKRLQLLAEGMEKTLIEVFKQNEVRQIPTPMGTLKMLTSGEGQPSFIVEI